MSARPVSARPGALGQFAYPMVLAALPRHGALFAAKRPPISRIGLDRRLALLPEDDRAEIAAIEGVLSWREAQRLKTDAAAFARADEVLAQVRSPAVRALVEERLAMRAGVAALRRHARGAPAPARGERWGRTPHGFRIRRAWSQPGFALGPSEGWLVRAQACLAASDPLGAEREILGETWRRLARASARFPHGYVAVVIYVLRWSLIDRWTSYAACPARARFHEWTARLAATALERLDAPR